METIHNRLSQYRSSLKVSKTYDDFEKQHECIDMNLHATGSSVSSEGSLSLVLWTGPMVSRDRGHHHVVHSHVPITSQGVHMVSRHIELSL